MKSSPVWNIALVAVALGLAYLILELVVFPFALPQLPLKQHDYLGGLGILAQSSKAGTVPTDYIALVGDSYAQGVGDWLLDTDPDGNGPFHSAHVLHQLSGRDVITFGRAGSGSLEGLAKEPISKYHYIDSSPWYALDPPQVIVAYIYEGNDFDNNVRSLRKVDLMSRDGATTVPMPDIERFVSESSERSVRDTGTAWAPVLYYVLRAIAGTANYLMEEERDPEKQLAQRGHTQPKKGFRRKSVDSNETREPNIALVAGEPVTLPSSLHAPAMELTEPELDSAVSLLRASLAALRRSFPDSDLVVAYLPSTLVTYRLVSKGVNVQQRQHRGSNFPAAEIGPRSNMLCHRTQQAAVAVGARFFDVRPAMRRAGEQRILHGPKDWKHFNRAGYTVLGQAVYDFLLADPAEDPGCAVM